VVAAASLAAFASNAEDGTDVLTLRWILCHLVEGVARHVGHLDLLREQLDGARGHHRGHRAGGPRHRHRVPRLSGVPKLQLLPAVDVADGLAVRLVQGEAGSETSYGDPLDAALQWQRDGAEWVHLVDLDAAFGRGSNRDLLARVVGELDVDVELSGGIRDDESLAAALATGCRRVNLGTAALESPEWCARAIAEHGDRIAVGLDVRGTRLAARGWTREGGELYETLARLDAEGCARYVVTDITKDGTLRGPNLDLLREVCAATPRPVVASGGVSSLEDIRALAGLTPVGIEGAIVGKALYAGAFTLPEALRVTEAAAS
jgi:phosphoribosyl isomerase A